MGKLVTVWSSDKKTGKTVFLYTLASCLSKLLSKECRILVCCMNLSYGNLMDLFRIGKGELNIEDVVNYRIHPDNNQFSLLDALARRDNFYYIGSKKTSPSYAARNMKIYEELLGEFRQEFDLCLFDTVYSRENPLTNMVIDKSDHVLNVINQDTESLERTPFKTGKELFFIVNRYRDIYPRERELSQSFGLGNTFTLPCSDELQDMKNKGKLEVFVQMDNQYTAAVKAAAEALIDKLELQVGTEAGRDKRKKGVLSSLLGGLF